MKPDCRTVTSFWIGTGLYGGWYDLQKGESGEFIPVEEIIEQAKECGHQVSLGGDWSPVGRKGWGEKVDPDVALELWIKLRKHYESSTKEKVDTSKKELEDWRSGFDRQSSFVERPLVYRKLRNPVRKCYDIDEYEKEVQKRMGSMEQRYKGFILEQETEGVKLRTNEWSNKMFPTFTDFETAKQWIDSLSREELDYYLGPVYSKYLFE
jgi:hypothetical protein